jgi:hypothetical protein
VKYAFEMGSGVMIYKLRFIKIVLGIPNWIVGGGHTNRQHGDRTSLLLFKK